MNIEIFNVIAVIIGGGLGASLRYLFSKAFNKHFGLTHWGTFVINIIGCFFMGYILTLSTKTNLIPTVLKTFLCVGILGGFTTFSTFSYENMTLLRNGQLFKSFIYIISSLAVGLLAVIMGIIIAEIS